MNLVNYLFFELIHSWELKLQFQGYALVFLREYPVVIFFENGDYFLVNKLDLLPSPDLEDAALGLQLR